MKKILSILMVVLMLSIAFSSIAMAATLDSDSAYCTGTANFTLTASSKPTKLKVVISGASYLPYGSVWITRSDTGATAASDITLSGNGEYETTIRNRYIGDYDIGVYTSGSCTVTVYLIG